MRKASKKEIEEVIHKGLVFQKARQEDDNDGKVRTKAKKKAYRTGAHGSASAIKKSQHTQTPGREIQTQPVSRHKRHANLFVQQRKCGSGNYPLPHL